MKLLSKYTEEAYGLFRIAAGYLFLCHGGQKIAGLWADGGHHSAFEWVLDMVGLLIALFVIVGFQTRIAAFLVGCRFAEDYIHWHWKFAFNANFFPVVNDGEKAFLLWIVFFYIAVKGGGKWSMDVNR
jgi:putative oxidoreductase